METRVCWKYCHMLTRRMTGAMSWPAIIWNAMSSPTVMVFSMTQAAPIQRMARLKICWRKRPMEPATLATLMTEKTERT